MNLTDIAGEKDIQKIAQDNCHLSETIGKPQEKKLDQILPVQKNTNCGTFKSVEIILSSQSTKMDDQMSPFASDFHEQKRP